MLLVAEEDKQVFTNLESILLKIDIRLKDYVKSPSRNTHFEHTLFEQIDSSHSNTLLFRKSLFIALTATYLLQNQDGFLMEESAICKMANKYVQSYLYELNMLDEEKSAEISKVLDALKFSHADWNCIRSIKSSDALYKIRLEGWIPKDRSGCAAELIDKLDNEEQQEIVSCVSAYWDLLLGTNTSFSIMFANTPVTKADQKTILSSLLPFVLTKGGCRPHHYFTAQIIYLLGKEIGAMRDFYWQHNEETQYLENHRLEEEIELLKRENSSLKDSIQKLTTQIRRTEKEILANNHEQMRFYQTENRGLKDKLFELESVLKNTQTELNDEPLAENEIIESTKDVSKKFTDISNKYKIVVIGGHINWRNKLKMAYPEVEVIDGTVTTIDIKVLDHAELVVFNTYNMSHAVYEKVIEHLRQSNTRFAYLPRITNPTLIATELLKFFD